MFLLQINYLTISCIFILSEELRKWFLSMETALFRYRFRQESPEVQVCHGHAAKCFDFYSLHCSNTEELYNLLLSFAEVAYGRIWSFVQSS